MTKVDSDFAQVERRVAAMFVSNLDALIEEYRVKERVDPAKAMADPEGFLEAIGLNPADYLSTYAKPEDLLSEYDAHVA